MTCSNPSSVHGGIIRRYQQPFRSEVYHLCDDCYTALTEMGLTFHAMAEEPTPFVPVWRRRALRPRDMSGVA
jgi:hypothetical protein